MPNRLAAATSLYLLQHAHNPVDWYPWGAEAFARARAENKLVLVSIGYSACHWCHVMERESFEDAGVAEVMNRHFVCIKVDREERPDVDHTYMAAVQIMRGQGGWPLNCFTLPDGRPLYGGTYFAKPQWLQVLHDLAAYYEREPEKAAEYAENLTDAVRQMELAGAVPAEPPPPATPQDLTRIWALWMQRVDAVHGGTQGAPKFPVPASWRFLLHYAQHSQDPEAAEPVRRTLDAMARGGIYDQVGGGFARYSVDAYWRVPHFEKMLYDNAQLVTLYSEAIRFERTQPQPDEARIAGYSHVVRQTLAFAEDELLHPLGGFYSALDADSEGVEGKFYTWPADEFDAALGELAPLFRVYWNVAEDGNWEETNILFRTQADAAVAEQFGIGVDMLLQQRAEAIRRLHRARATRVRPGLDDKVLAGWNGMMCRALVDAFRALGEVHYLRLAQQNMAFVQAHMTDHGHGLRLLRSWKADSPEARSGRAAILGNLEDYAHHLDALVALYQATFDEAYLLRARDLATYVHTHFADEASGLYWFTQADAEDETPRIARKQELHDSVVPSSNAVLAHALWSLAQLLDNGYFAQRAERMLAAVRPHLEKYATGFAHWELLLLRQAMGDREVAICGPRASQVRAALDRYLLPDVLLCGTGRDVEGHTDVPLLAHKCHPGKTMIYVCTNRSCRQPTEDVAEALRDLGVPAGK